MKGQLTGKVNDECDGCQERQVREEDPDGVAEQRERGVEGLGGEIDLKMTLAKIAVHRIRVAYGGILYKDVRYAALMVVLAGTAGLSAQSADSDASAKLKQFEENLANAMKVRGVVSVQKTAPPNGVCAIPLLKVAPDAAFKSNMPVIAPDSNVQFAMRQVTPPAPSCDEQAKK